MTRLKNSLPAASVFLLASLAACSAEFDDSALEESSDDDAELVIEERTIAGGGACDHIPGYPPPPDWEGPGDHCGKKRPKNPGCAPGTEGVCDIPCSYWPGPYDLYEDNCHNACDWGVSTGACCGQETGILSCKGNTTGLTGHTVNYTVTPAPAPNEGKFVVCLSEPQHSDPDATKCCWLQDSEDPETAQGEPGHACYRHRCNTQSEDDGGEVLPVGECWPDPGDVFGCGDTYDAAGIKCCKDHAKYWDGALAEWCDGENYPDQVANRCDAYIECIESIGGTIPDPPPPGEECNCANSNGAAEKEADGWTCDESTCAEANGGNDCFCQWTLVHDIPVPEPTPFPAG